MEKRKIWKTAAICVGAAVGLWLFLKLLFPVTLPFFLGLLAALAVRKPISVLEKKLKFSRSAASFFCVLLLDLLLAGMLFFLGQFLMRQLTDAVHRFPQMAEQMEKPMKQLERRLLTFADAMPDGLGAGLHAGLEKLFSGGAELGSRLYSWLFDAAGRFMELLPELGLFAVTSVISGFMISGQLPRLYAAVCKRIPEEKLQKLQKLRRQLKQTLGCWLLAQLKLMGVTFGVVSLGLFILQQRGAIFLGGIIALVDALPVLGTGLILIPWAVVSFLQADTKMGVGLLVIYGAAALLRQTLEPRLVGNQIGLEPIVTLLAMYTGFRLVGVGGMVLFPLAAIFLKQLWDHSGLRKAE